jgi:hydroxyethylthiazole kinase-like uncharacterized protein yjeF
MSRKIFPRELEGQKIVYATDMALMEKRAISEKDNTDDGYMILAADGIFEQLQNFFNQRNLKTEVILLCGKGNNAGDAYAVGERLLNVGYSVKAFQLFPLKDCSKLCRLHAKQFEHLGGEIIELKNSTEFEVEKDVLILDGIFGSGFKGQVEGLIEIIIDKVNQLSNPVVSIDIPSGVFGDTGSIGKSAINAEMTIYLGALKVGHLFNQGYQLCGELVFVDFGMSKMYLDEIPPYAYVVNPEIASKNLPQRARNTNKYLVGQAIIVAGSRGMPGSSLLASKACLRSGAGMVRLFHPKEMADELFGCPFEIVRHIYSALDFSELKKEMKRTKALLVGPGLGRSEEVPKILEKIYEIHNCPIVIDGDALFFFQAEVKNAILTPHRGELKKLLSIEDHITDLELIEKAEAYARECEVIIVFKGAPTVVIAPNYPKVVIPFGNKGMASAGMGDVLAGIIVSFLAQGKTAREAAILGALIHALAGDQAKKTRSEYGLLASDVIESLCEIFLTSETQ